MRLADRPEVPLCAAILPVCLVALHAMGGEIRVGPPAAPSPLAQANHSAKPGDIIVLAEGVYNTPISPARSGEPGKPIVYRAAPGAEVRFANMHHPIVLRGRSHITVEGITAGPIGGYILAEGCSHITISGCTFDDNWGSDSCLFKGMGECLRFVKNVVRDGNRLLSVQGGGGHLIEGNKFDETATCLVLMGVERSVIRGNTFLGHGRKPGSRDWPRRDCLVCLANDEGGRAARRNVIEGNLFAQSWFGGLEYAATGNLVRRNVFRKCGAVMDLYAPPGSDSPRASFDYAARFANNLVFECGSKDAGALFLRAPGVEYGRQVLLNNLFWRNQAGPKDGDPAAKESEADPQFADEVKGDFRLKSGSPCVDAGAPLTKAKGAGKGTEIDVEDALFFSDGCGVVEPDVICVGAERVKAVKIDCEKNRIVLDRSISWEAGAPVSPDYKGKAPDVGAHESGGDDGRK